MDARLIYFLFLMRYFIKCILMHNVVSIWKLLQDFNHEGISSYFPKLCFAGGDQGLLNLFFNDWATKDISKHLSFIYNMNTSTSYTYLPAYKQ